MLHSLPYSRISDIDGVYTSPTPSLCPGLTTFIFALRCRIRIGPAALLYRAAIKKFWNGDSQLPRLSSDSQRETDARRWASFVQPPV